MNEDKPKYESGIYGKAEARFGGKIYVDVVRFTGKDSIERHGITLSEFYNGGEVGSTPADQRLHDPQIYLVFDNMKSVEMVELALASVRELMKRDAEKAQQPETEHNPALDITIDDCREDLSVRAYSICKAYGIRTLRDLTLLHKTDWLKFRNGGKKSLECIDDLLTKHGLTWAKWE